MAPPCHGADRLDMALELRPNCEYCDKDLPPDAADARICTYECTFCADCVDDRAVQCLPELRWRVRAAALSGPRPSGARGLCLAKRPASTKRVHLSYDREEVARFAKMVRDIPPEKPLDDGPCR